MADKLYEESNVRALADAIRKKNGETGQYTLGEMDAKVMQLPSSAVIIHPEIPYDEEKASEIAAVAQSYLDAIEEGSLKILYQAGYSALSGANQKIKNDAGQYIIQCSAFVGLCLRGIAYRDSPYYAGDGTKTSARTDLYTWANTYYERNGFTEANQLAFYAFQTGCMIRSRSVEDIRKGDILFYRKGTTSNFGNIWHIALALKDGGTRCVHACSGNAASGIWTYDMTNPPAILGELCYIARPQYNVDFSVQEEPVEPDAPLELKILAHPSDQSGAAGSNAVFTVLAQGEGLTYQWQFAKAATPNNWQNSSFEGFNTNTQTVGIESFRNGDWYRCVITDVGGNKVTSNVAKIIMLS